ncbi:UDP-glucose pyrophosphorylase [Thermanaeromonas toyohensis ToBE]|uniref:UTP--glucose-1-phosphate uridylyltransferase n=1 Tax=Thermanaeromonas toyohensis ToBE TaxID=698762 RepID=A0A1W1VYL3_9FIRM|nr:UTP--glucose-1-phosphate uridylyltransferase GalU [Thermanaeromonas toyohensis]SMB98455.1 UDP-glucose pyrophosphorylase [Thermanaeromonas toyohensis ToBE]
MLPIRKAVIPAAGWGTRFLPATKAQPKEMLPIVDKPAIQYIVEEAVRSGVNSLLIITGKHKRAIEDHFDQSLELSALLREKNNLELLQVVEEVASLADIHYIRQKEQLGLGHAVHCARQFVGEEPFAVLLGDDIIVNDIPCLKQMIEAYKEVGQAIVAVQEVPLDEVKRYGIVEPAGATENGLFQVKGLVEKPDPQHAPSNLAVIGRYILLPEIFPILADLPPGAGGEIQLTDALNILAREGRVYAYRFAGRRYDVGDKLGFLQATVEFALERPDLAVPFRNYLLNLLAAQLEIPEAAASRDG